jgi:hypothetical protein
MGTATNFATHATVILGLVPRTHVSARDDG